MDFKLMLFAQTPIYIVSSLIMTRSEGRLIDLGDYEKISGDYSKQAGKVIFNALVALIASWFF